MSHKSRSPTRLSGITSLLGNSAWAIREGAHRQLVQEFNTYLASGPATQDRLEALQQTRAERAAEVAGTQEQAPSVAIISLYGTILPRGSMMVELCGAASPHNFADDVLQAANDPSISSIILDIDSGGGAVSGIDVAAEAVRQAGVLKQVTAVCNTTCCSAALWIASAAREIVITPAGEIGSIGVIGTHVDESQALENAGLKVTYVRSTPGKALGQSTEAMEGDVLDSWQGEVDQLHTLFVNAIAQGRNVSPDFVRSEWATGAVWFGQDAVNAGLADRVGTLQDVVGAHLLEAQQQAARQARKDRRGASGLLKRMDAEVETLRGFKGANAERLAQIQRNPHELYAELDRACADSSPDELTDFQGLRAEVGELQHGFAATLQAAERAAPTLPPVTPPPAQEEPPMKIKLQAADGTMHEVENTEEAVQAFVTGQLTAAATGTQEALQAATAEHATASAARLTSIGALFALTPEQATASDLGPWQAAANNANAVADHRAALLTELGELAVTVDGNSTAAAQIVKLASSASLPDLSATVTAYRDRRDATIPAGRKSRDAEIREEEVAEKPKKPLNYDSN